MSVLSEVLKEAAEPAPAQVHVVVKGKEKGNLPWKEVADLITYSSTGSSFNLSRRCEAGTLVELIIPLPVIMRCYDHDKEFYGVWGLIQYCEPMTAEGSAGFHIGVAFIGKDAPESYEDNPLQHYRISGVKAGGMWAVDESKTPFKKRGGVRFWHSIALYLALVDNENGTRGGERTVTENVSRRGASVFTTLNIGIGDRVKFISAAYDFSGLAVVCNAEVGEDGRKRIHLQFIESTFPITKLMKSKPPLRA